MQSQVVLRVAATSSVTLEGTLTIPANAPSRSPVVLLLPGSGPLDREANAKALKTQCFTHLRDLFLSKGVSVFQYDKRGAVQFNNKNKSVFLKTGFHENVEDANAVFDTLAKHHLVDPLRIILCGHSEGGYTASRLYALRKAQSKAPSPLGIIFLSGFGTPFEQVLKYQIDGVVSDVKTATGVKGWILRLLTNPAKFIKQQQATLKRIRESDKDVLSFGPFGIVTLNARWYREFLTYDPTPDYAVIQCPCLVVFGGKDLQVPRVDESTCKSLLPSTPTVVVHFVPDMNHLLRAQSTPASFINIKTDYRAAVKRRLDPDLTDGIAVFVGGIV